MMPNITSGGDTAGLMRYLIGPGKANEHTNPHVVAGAMAIDYQWSQVRELESFDAIELARGVDVLMDAQDVHPQGKRRQWNPDTQRMETIGTGPNHVWHCSLSLRAEEGELTDEQWATIAKDFVSEMGIADGDIRTDCAWVAIRHGLSAGGNDHVHIVVNKVQADGHAWKNYMDYRRAQKACNILEQRHGLNVLESRMQGRGAIHDSANEHNAARANGQPATYRAMLEARVRAAATAAANEPDFIHQLHKVGVRVRPYFAKGRTDIVNGYSVALREHEIPAGTDSPWRAGSKISKDLGLRVLRTRWEDTPQSATEAAQAWREVWHSDKQEWKTRPLTEGEAAAQQSAAKAFSDQLKTVNPNDPVALANASADIAGALAAIAANPDAGRVAWEIRRLSRQVAYDAQLNTRTSSKDHRPQATVVAARLLMTALAHNNPEVKTGLLVASAIELVVELAGLYKAAHQANTAATLETAATQTLASVQANYRLYAHANAQAQTSWEHADTPRAAGNATEQLLANEPPALTPEEIDALWLEPEPTGNHDANEQDNAAMNTTETEMLDTLNPTGTVHTDYAPELRATLPLADNLVPLSQTEGLDDTELVTIYRGVPTQAEAINPGDFITTNKQLATDYAGSGHVVQMQVPASHILDDATEPGGEEYIYRPPTQTQERSDSEHAREQHENPASYWIDPDSAAISLNATEAAWLEDPDTQQPPAQSIQDNKTTAQTVTTDDDTSENVDEYADDIRQVIPEQDKRAAIQEWARQQIAAGHSPHVVMAMQNEQLAKLHAGPSTDAAHQLIWPPTRTHSQDHNQDLTL